MNEAKTPKSLYFEEFKIGDKFYSASRTLTSDDVDEFARITGDRNPIHTDEEFARGSIHGKRIAHGLLGLSLVSGLAAQLGFAEETTMAFRGLSWKFKKPAGIGDSIKAVFEVIDKRQIPVEKGGLIVFRVVVTNQEDQKIQIGKWSLIIKMK